MQNSIEILNKLGYRWVVGQPHCKVGFWAQAWNPRYRDRRLHADKRYVFSASGMSIEEAVNALSIKISAYAELQEEKGRI